MEVARFVFWEAMKVVGLAFLGLLAVKAVGGLPSPQRPESPRGANLLQLSLYAVIAALCIVGAWNIGFDIAAETYFWVSASYREKGQVTKAYDDAVRAVELRPGNLSYWRGLALAKIYARQFDSLLGDQPAFQQLSGEQLDETDAYRFLLCHFYLGHYDQVIALADQMIARNREYAAPYVLRGMSLIALKKYAEAERTFLRVLQFQPANQAAVEGLAHVYFLRGERLRAVAVLEDTARFPFPADARKRFEALKGLYAQ